VSKLKVWVTKRGLSLIARPRPGWAAALRGKVTVALTWQLALPAAPAFGSFCLFGLSVALWLLSIFFPSFSRVRASVCWIAGWREMDGRLWLVGGAFGRRWGGLWASWHGADAERRRSMVVSDEEDLWIGCVVHVVNGSPGLLLTHTHTMTRSLAPAHLRCSAVRSPTEETCTMFGF